MNRLILDCNYLSYQAFHTLGELSHGGVESGVVFGFLNRVLSLGHRFQTNRFAFCWDSKESFRRELYPKYKGNRRKEKTPEEKAQYDILYTQMTLLRHSVLDAIGFRNVFEQRGIESDDLMAEIVKTSSEPSGDIIVTSDEDLFQCLREGCSIHNPSSKKLWTKASFEEEYGITPEEWVWVKIIAGCKGDNVAGVQGVAETTAIKWIRNELKAHTKKFKDIQEQVRFLKETNEILVRLPFPKTLPIHFNGDELNPTGLMFVAEEYGMMSYLKGEQAQRWQDLFECRFSADTSEIGRAKHRTTTSQILEHRRRRR
jgi:5'-3' exonuclease